MSLTSFIKASKDYRDLIRDNFIKPKFNAGPLIAEPKTQNYGLVGTAFDYLLRFKIERKNKCKAMPWIASTPKQIPLAEEINVEARTLLNLYLKTGKMTKALMESALKLATIDNVVRSGQGADMVGSINPLDLEDLSNLYKLIDADKFKSRQSCYLNPTFGIGSELVAGADADLIIDGALIDVKTTIKPDFTRSYFEQLIGYFLLHIIDCEDRNVPVSIKKLGIYFSRHGCLFLMDVADLVDESELPNIVSAFRDLLLISVPRELSDEEKAKKAALSKVKAKIERRKEKETHGIYIRIFEESELEWAEPWNIAREAGESAIEANPSIKRSELIKIINNEINKFLTPARSVPVDALFWTGCGSSPSEILREGSVRVANGVATQFRNKHLSDADRAIIKTKRREDIAKRKLFAQIKIIEEKLFSGWCMAIKAGEDAKESNNLLNEKDLVQIIYEKISKYLVRIKYSQTVAESISVLGHKPYQLHEVLFHIANVTIAKFKKKQARKNRR